ncbi:uncharacterized protein LOC129234097 [Uloborus diversus]|uniref:uncharacterized protein LOC129234097 n=1 Tax=Uloborus diversus TaxID=327109 RepID=UPI002409AF6F|nr:uncharacterized protein LOC129234097 [Uloborus diversus]
MKSIFFCIVCVFLLVNACIVIAEISFLNYCNSGQDPDPFPGDGDEVSGSIVMNTEKINGTWYEPSMNCSVTFRAADGFQLFLTFSNVSLRNASMDNLTITYNDQKNQEYLAGQQVCSNENCIGLKFDSGKSGNLTLKFLSSNVSVPQNVTGFHAHYSVYSLVNPKNQACNGKNRFLCENGHCVLETVVCDGHNDCGDNSDETKCIISVRDTVWAIVVIVMALISVIIMVPLFCCLAIYGTRSVVKSVTLTNPAATALLPAGDQGEIFGLLTSSDAAMNVWPGSSYDRSLSLSYGTNQYMEPSTSSGVNRFRSQSEVVDKPKDNKVL